MRKRTLGRYAVGIAGALAVGVLAGSPVSADIINDWNTAVAPPPPELKEVTVDPSTTALLFLDIMKAGCSARRMVSGAGHDAMILAEQIPTAMIFLRTPGGISHHPSESVSVEDVAKAIECGTLLLTQLAGSVEFQKRMCRA